jgi:predicted GH43/DUF377 family glycosyl hydrolase
VDDHCQEVGVAGVSWEKRGVLFAPDGKYPWMQTHAQLPTPDLIGGNIYRIYFASRDGEQRSSINFIEIDITQPKKILRVSDQPVLTCGPKDHFDEHGVLPASIVSAGEKKYLYYTGWRRGSEPGLFHYAAGLAVSSDGGRLFQRYSNDPVLPLSKHDPCLVASPFVLIEGGLWKMFYVSGFLWEKNAQGPRPFYHIKYAYSSDGVHWMRNGDVAIDFKTKDERNIARTWVIKDDNTYRAWYCYASLEQKYRIGYAESIDGIHFQRNDDQANIDLSGKGFDQEMMCYPSIVKQTGMMIMFYNGNSYGKDGFGMAVLES